MKFILRAKDMEGRHLALRAAEWLAARPYQEAVIIAYGERPTERDFFVSRTKVGIKRSRG